MPRGARFAAAMTSVASRLPFGLAEVVPPSVIGYLLINLCTFFLDLALLAAFHGSLRWPVPLAVTLSYGTAGLVSYAANRVFNFRSHGALGRQLPLYLAVMVSNYLMFVLGLTTGLTAVGVYYELSRVVAAVCEGVYLYCCMRWIVFRDAEDAFKAPRAPSSTRAVKAQPGGSGGSPSRANQPSRPAARSERR